MSTLTDKAWESLQNDETVFEVGVCTFNGCNVKVIKRQEPYQYVTKTGNPATKSARYWGKFVFPNGVEKTFAEERGGAIARSTGFSVKTERALYKEQGDKYTLPYLR